MDIQLELNDRMILFSTVREAIESFLFHRPPLYPNPTPTLLAHCGVFVTLKNNDKLRGCIGRMISSEPLFDTIKEMAHAAAFQDPRFPFLSETEWKNIQIEISILSPLRKIQNLHEITPGIHGLLVSGYGRSGVLLPQVATEWNWDQETFILQTLNKAGLSEKLQNDPGLSFEIFTALVINDKEGLP